MKQTQDYICGRSSQPHRKNRYCLDPLPVPSPLTSERTTKETQPMSDTLQEREDQTMEEEANEHEIRRIRRARLATTTDDYCNECKGQPHAPWCSSYKEQKVTHCVCGIPSSTGLCEHLTSAHQPAARGGGESERFGFVVFTGRHKILDYHKPDGQQIATANDEDAARLIVRALNQHQSLVAERDALRSFIQEFADKGCVLRGETCLERSVVAPCIRCRATALLGKEI